MKPTTKPPFNEAKTFDESPTIASFHVRKVIYEHVPIKRRANGHQTYGQILDELLRNAAETHSVVQSIEFEIDEDEWQRTAEQILGLD